MILRNNRSSLFCCFSLRIRAQGSMRYLASISFWKFLLCLSTRAKSLMYNGQCLKVITSGLCTRSWSRVWDELSPCHPLNMMLFSIILQLYFLLICRDTRKVTKTIIYPRKPVENSLDNKVLLLRAINPRKRRFNSIPPILV